MWCSMPVTLPSSQLEGDARQEDAVEEALQDRRIAEIPDREDEHQRLRRLQPLDIGLDRLRG